MKINRRVTTVLGVGLALNALMGIYGCQQSSNQPYIKSEENKPHLEYFAEIPMLSESGMALTSGDFDGDGDLDIIAGAKTSSLPGKAKLYLFKNDGKGNFSQ